MATNRLNLALPPLLRAARAHEAGCKTDGQLLREFVAHRDETAFTTLVRRHGPMVLGVCRRILGNAADAEDAFQAAFIVLLRKAAALNGRAVLGDYLHGVARRTALKARCAAARRRAKEQMLTRSVAATTEVRNDFLPLLDEELTRLPEKYRLPIVLCDLEGNTRHEAASQLGWPEGTVAGRLARGRALLAKRLVRGAQVISGVLPAALVPGAAQAALPAGLVGLTVQAVTSIAAGKTTAPPVASGSALTLAQGVMQAMFWNKIKLGAIILLAAVVTTGLGGLTYQVFAGEGQTPGQTTTPEKASQAQKPAAASGTVAKENAPLVREIDLKGFVPGLTEKIRQQTIITDAKQLADAITDKEWQIKIAKQVDFDKERLLFFYWWNGPEDKLSFRVEEGKSGPVVVFKYTLSPNSVTFTVPHTHLFALGKDVGFRVENDAKKPEGDKRVREIDITAFRAKPPDKNVRQQAIVTSDEQLAQIFPTKEWHQKIVSQVDFDKERLLYFAWVGGPLDKLLYKVEDGKTGPIAVFTYVFGKSTETEAHAHLFALSNDVGWKVADEEKENPALSKPPCREIDLKGYKAESPKGSVYEPKQVSGGEKEISQVFRDLEWQAKIVKQVNFAQEELLFFAWSGPSDDKIGWMSRARDTDPVTGARTVVFTYKPGSAPPNDTPHFRLFALAAKTKWRVEGGQNAPAHDEKKPEADKRVREIDITAFKAKPPEKGDYQETTITQAEQLAAIFPDKEWQQKVAAQVDFDKQRLLYFAWVGGNADKLGFEYKISQGFPNPIFTFTYILGKSTETASHAHLFVLDKNIGWKIERGAAVREIDVKGLQLTVEASKAFGDPTTITSARELGKLVPKEEDLARITEQVDFTNEQLLLFAWSGPSGDRLTWSATHRAISPITQVSFNHFIGEDDKKASHYHLFAVANKSVKWQAHDTKGPLPADRTNPRRPIPPTPGNDTKPPPPADTTNPNKQDTTAKLLKDLESKDEFVRAVAIDLLGQQKAKAAIPKLIALLSDGTALIGSDNWVGGHAANALSAITGESFDTDQKKWQEWLKTHPVEAATPEVNPMAGGVSGVKVLSAEATVELHGVLAYTPKGVFVLVQEERRAWNEPETATTWELDFTKTPELEKQAKAWSGKAVVATGACKMTQPIQMSGPYFPADTLVLQKIVVLTKLSVVEKK